MQHERSAWSMRTSFGSWNPEQCLVSVIDERGEAALAVRALREAGCADAQICLLSGAEWLSQIEQARRRLGAAKRALLFVADFSDNALFEAQYLDEARHDRQILVVRLPERDRVRQISALLERYHAHLLRYYGRWTVTDVVSTAEAAAARPAPAYSERVVLGEAALRLPRA